VVRLSSRRTSKDEERMSGGERLGHGRR
jgi:hypothetical protein